MNFFFFFFLDTKKRESPYNITWTKMISHVYNFLSILHVRTYFLYFTISFYKIPTSDHPLNTQFYLYNIFHFLFIIILLLILSPLKYLSHLNSVLLSLSFTSLRLLPQLYASLISQTHTLSHTEARRSNENGPVAATAWHSPLQPETTVTLS